MAIYKCHQSHHQIALLKVGCRVRSALRAGISIHMGVVVGNATTNFSFIATSDGSTLGSDVVVATACALLATPDPPTHQRDTTE